MNDSYCLSRTVRECHFDPLALESRILYLCFRLHKYNFDPVLSSWTVSKLEKLDQTDILKMDQNKNLYMIILSTQESENNDPNIHYKWIKMYKPL